MFAHGGLGEKKLTASTPLRRKFKVGDYVECWEVRPPALSYSACLVLRYPLELLFAKLYLTRPLSPTLP